MGSVTSIQQAIRPQDADLVETGRCSDACFTASMLTDRGRSQKFCQLVWATMIPALALAIYSTADFVQSVNDYRSRQRDLRPAASDIKVAAACIRTIRGVQSLRLSSTMYLGSGDVDGDVSRDVSNEALIIDDYIRSSFDETLKVIDASRSMAAAQSEDCDFASVVKAFDSEVSTPLRILFAIGDATTASSESTDDVSPTAYCTVYDYIAARILLLKNLTLSSAYIGRNSSTATATDGVASFRLMTNLVDLLHHNCLERLMIYSGGRPDTLQLFRIWISLVELEEAYSALDLLGALHFLAAESGRNAVQLRILAISYDRLAVDAYRHIHVVGGISIPDLPVDDVRSAVAAIVDEKLVLSPQPTLLTSQSARQQSLIIARWISQLQDALESLAQATDGVLATIDQLTTDERRVISQTIGLDIFVWFLVFAFIGPLVTVNAERNMEAVKAYTNSFESKEHELKMEKRKTEALLNEMLPRLVRRNVIGLMHFQCTRM